MKKTLKVLAVCAMIFANPVFVHAEETTDSEPVDDGTEMTEEEIPEETISEEITENEITEEAVQPEADDEAAEVIEDETYETVLPEEESENAEAPVRTMMLAAPSTGFVTRGGSTYYIDPNTLQYVTGGIAINGNGYFFDSNGVMLRNSWKDYGARGWAYYGSDGKLYKGKFATVKDENGKTENTYYFSNSGYRMTGGQAINGNGYFFNDKGVMLVSSWKDYSARGWAYYGSDGKLYKGQFAVLKDENNKTENTYYFSNSGYRMTGGQAINGNGYFFDDKGVMLVSSWKDYGTRGWAYYGSDGKLYKGKFAVLKDENNKTENKYYFNKSGYRATGGVAIDGNGYFFDNKGVMLVSSWKDYGTKGWAYYGTDGILYKNKWAVLKDENNKTENKYYFNKSGYRATGGVAIDGNGYFFDNKGVMLVSSWKDYGTKGWAYYGADGILYKNKWAVLKDETGKKTIKYYFTKSGYRATGITEVDGKKLCFDNSGAQVTGWQEFPDEHKTCYFDPDTGEMVTGKVEIDGKVYFFNETTGALMEHLQQIKDENGKWITVYYQDGEIVKKNFKADKVYYQVNPVTGEIIHMQTLFTDAIYMEGIDISEHNGNIDLTKYQNGFVIIRIGYWTTPDKMAIRNMDLCEKYNIPYGVYLYDYTTEPEDAVTEAEFTLKMIKGRNIRCGVWFDMEDDGWRARNGVAPNHPNISKICQKYCETIERAGYHVGIYASYSWFENYITGCDKWDKWVAHWGSNNGNWNTNLSKYCPMHQYTSIPLDTNVMYVDPSYFEK